MFLIPSIKIKKTKTRGRGVFASQNIPGGSVIGDYLGTVIHTDDSDFSKGLYTLTWGDDDEAVIQADPDQLGIHLVNHSCIPNCGMTPLGGRTLYFALRKIFKGEELTVQYLMGEPDEDCNPCKDVCHCGEILCQGTMHCSNYMTDEYDKYEWRIHGHRPIPKPPSYGTRLELLEHYPKTIADDKVFTLFGSKSKPPLAIKEKRILSIKKIRTLIRQSGRRLKFTRLNLIIAGVRDNYIVLDNRSS